MAAISRAFAPPWLFRTKPPPAFDDDDDDERGLPPDDDDDKAAHAVIAEHTAHLTHWADGGCTKTVPHPRCCGVPKHVILGIILARLLSLFFVRGKRGSSLGRISSLEKEDFDENNRATSPAQKERERKGEDFTREEYARCCCCCARHSLERCE